MQKCILIIFSAVLYIGGCQSINLENYSTQTYSEIDEIVIPVIFLIDTISNIKANEALVEDFNKEYSGVYRMNVEWLPGSPSDYRSKIKMLNSINELPAIVTDVGFDPAFYNLLIENNRIINVKQYIDKDVEWKSYFNEANLLACTEVNGGIYMIPQNGLYCAGLFWNEELFNKAGLYSFPKTWEEFFYACEKLKSSGITPLSLHTMGTSWTSMLIATAYIGSSKDGLNFIKQRFPNTYDNKEFKEMMEIYIKLYSYTTKDAIDGDFEIAANHFYKGNTAMIANGEWMIENFANHSYVEKGFDQKIHFSSFPNNVVISSPEMSAWSISADHSKLVQEGAIEFMKYRSKDEKMTLDLQSAYDEENWILPRRDYLNAIKNIKTIVPNYQTKWNFIIQNEIFTKELPSLINGSLTIDDFIKIMDDGVKQYNQK